MKYETTELNCPECDMFLNKDERRLFCNNCGFGINDLDMEHLKHTANYLEDRCLELLKENSELQDKLGGVGKPKEGNILLLALAALTMLGSLFVDSTEALSLMQTSTTLLVGYYITRSLNKEEK